MFFLYRASIVIICVLGIVHAGYTFFRYGALHEESLWFFSGSLAMLMAAVINYLHLEISTRLTRHAALVVNIINAAFCIPLFMVYPLPRTVGIFLACLFITIISLRWTRSQK